MLKWLSLVLVCMFPFTLSGCFNTEGMVTESLDALGKPVKVVSSAAVARDLAYTRQHENRDDKTAIMFKDSGIVFESKWERLDFGNGNFAYVNSPHKITVREKPSFQQDLETRPPDHRGWDTADKVVDTVWKGLGLFYITDAFKAMSANATPKYYGDYSPNSNNPITITEIPLAQ